MTGASSGLIKGGTALFQASGGGSVTSVFGRVGAVTAQSGDYSIAQISGAGTAAAENLSAVIIDDGMGGLTIGPGQVTLAMLASGVGVPGGSSGNIQFNNTGAFDGNSGLTYDGTGAITVSNQVTANTLYNNSANSSHIDLASSLLFDQTGNQNFDWNTKQLQIGTTASLDWGVFETYDSTAVESINWDSRTLFDTAGGQALQWGANRALFNASSVQTLNWQASQLSDYTSGFLAVDWNGRQLWNGTASFVIMDWTGNSSNTSSAFYWFDSNSSYRLTGDGSGLTGIVAGAAGPSGAVQFNSSGVISGDSGFTYAAATGEITLSSSVQVPYIRSAASGAILIDVNNTILIDTASFNSVDWTNRFLYASDGSTKILDWSNVGSGANYYFSGGKLIGDGSGLTGVSGVSFIDSLTESAGNVNLVNDNSSPGANYYYGTDGSGTKGFFSVPSGSGPITLDGSNNLYSSNGSAPSGVSNGILYGQGAITGSGCIALGYSTTATNNDDIAIGTSATANGGGNQAIAIGSSVATGRYSWTIGNSNTVSGNYSSVHGFDSTVNQDDTIFIGNRSGTTSIAGGIILEGITTAGPAQTVYLNPTTGGSVCVGFSGPPNAALDVHGSMRSNSGIYSDAGPLYTLGASSGNTLEFGNSATAPSASGSSPSFTSYYGGGAQALGDPDAWALVRLAGTDYKMPLYL